MIITHIAYTCVSYVVISIFSARELILYLFISRYRLKWIEIRNVTTAVTNRVWINSFNIYDQNKRTHYTMNTATMSCIHVGRRCCCCYYTLHTWHAFTLTLFSTHPFQSNRYLYICIYIEIWPVNYASCYRYGDTGVKQTI